MRKLLVSFVFLAMCFGFVSLAHGSHIKVGEPIGAFLYCETPELAETALTLLVAAKDQKTFQAYQNFVGDPTVMCLDSRSIGIPLFESIPVKRMGDYTKVTATASFVLWEVELNGMRLYTWEADLLSEA